MRSETRMRVVWEPTKVSQQTCEILEFCSVSCTLSNQDESLLELTRVAQQSCKTLMNSHRKCKHVKNNDSTQQSMSAFRIRLCGQTRIRIWILIQLWCCALSYCNKNISAYNCSRRCQLSVLTKTRRWVVSVASDGKSHASIARSAWRHCLCVSTVSGRKRWAFKVSLPDAAAFYVSIASDGKLRAFIVRSA